LTKKKQKLTYAALIGFILEQRTNVTIFLCSSFQKEGKINLQAVFLRPESIF